MKKFNLVIGFFSFTAFIGAALFFYPFIGRLWNSFHETRVVSDYVDEMSELDSEYLEEALLAAEEYNEEILLREDPFEPTAREAEEYETLLNVLDNGIMGYLDLPSLEQSLPIYHGTEESVLQVGVGHLDWSSLPVGGKGTHAVISGHSGLADKVLLTNLDKLELGDVFRIRVLNRTLSYEVDQILVTLPEDLTSLGIDEDKDYCTLVTCTPYGVNTHRLLVRGQRVYPEENKEESGEEDISEPFWMEPWGITVIAGAVVGLLLLSILVIKKVRK